ncbi:MAG TPA: hypothetical protein PLN31_10285 [Azoarcus taiwanensis]|nr:hypothetical protein [Azoarcus taiwanensis]
MADLLWYQCVLIGLIFVWSGFVRTGLGFGGAVLALPFLLLVHNDPLVFRRRPTLPLRATGIGFEPPHRRGLKGRERAWRLRATRNLRAGQSVPVMPPSDLAQHFHGDHLYSSASK